MPTNDDLFDLLRQMIDNSSKERKEMVTAFTGAIGEMKGEIRAMRRDLIISLVVAMLLMLMGSLARDGVFAKVGIPGVTVETHPRIDGTVEVKVEDPNNG